MKLLQTTDLVTTRLQFAAADVWENAVSKDEATANWIENAGRNIAIEAVYTDTLGALAGFIGFRRVIEDPKERCTFWRNVLLQKSPHQAESPAKQAAVWLEILKQPQALEMPPNTIELGVFNCWKSAGTITQTSEKWVPPRDFAAPDWLHEGAEAPICREYVWAVVDGFWVADAISKKVNGRHFLDAD
ncbi:hypothetical protein OO012_16185 [Rhodobacteraceae bacterium KMM 6894]|nr:hypothetical protein [Rhodobacteraceae bacterium KMM 6894]